MTRILITGAGGAVGSALRGALTDHAVIATDLRAPPGGIVMDVTGADVGRVMAAHRPEVVVHLASIVTPPPGMSRAAMQAVDVGGTQAVVQACVAQGVRRLVVTSSGAAYGYHPDTPLPVAEDFPLRGNPEFAYADHKRQVEDLLAQARRDHPALEQCVLRVGTVLGPGVDNQITALLRKPSVLAVRGYPSPWVFIDMADLVAILARAATDGPPGIFNVAGDGWLTPQELATIMGKPLRAVPAWALKAGLAVAHTLRLSRYGPEQVRFVQFRPVLDNSALKTRFGYTPRLSSRAAFQAWWGSVA